MLTPQNFREKTFDKAIFGGYDMGAVDDFLDEAANDYAALAKENMVLKSKMKVLVDKIEEYRATEESMRLTLLSAQKLSLQIEEEARKKAEEALTGARSEAERITREAYSQRTYEETLLIEAKRESAKYIENMRLVCTKQLEFLDGLKNIKLGGPPQNGAAAAEEVEETVRSIEDSVERFSDNGPEEAEIRRVVSETPNPSPRQEEPTRPISPGSAGGQSGAFSLDSLQFGK